jgi:hypothetical protein
VSAATCDDRDDASVAMVSLQSDSASGGVLHGAPLFGGAAVVEPPHIAEDAAHRAACRSLHTSGRLSENDVPDEEVIAAASEHGSSSGGDASRLRVDRIRGSCLVYPQPAAASTAPPPPTPSLLAAHATEDEVQQHTAFAAVQPGPQAISFVEGTMMFSPVIFDQHTTSDGTDASPADSTMISFQRTFDPLMADPVARPVRLTAEDVDVCLASGEWNGVPDVDTVRRFSHDGGARGAGAAATTRHVPSSIASETDKPVSSW